MCTAGLVGCVGVLDPVVTAPDRPGADVTISSAIAYANRAKVRYEDALTNQVRLSTWVGAGLIPLATVGAGMAIFSGNPTGIGILGLTGAGIYGTSAYLRNQPAQLAYLAGHEAINCAVEAVAPLVPIDAASDSPFGQALLGIEGHLADVALRAELLRRALGGSTDVAARNELDRASDLLVRGRETQAQAFALQASLGGLPTQLVTAVDRIQTQVSDAVVRNQPDLSALGSIVGNLGSVYKQLSPTPIASDKVRGEVPATPDAAFAAQPPPTTAALRSLQEANDVLARDQAVLSATIGVVAKATPTETLKKCVVNPDEFTTAMVLSPDKLTFAGGTQESRGFLVTGGRKPYAALVTSGGDGLSVRPTGAFSSAFVVDASPDASGKYLVTIEDVAGAARFLDVQVGAAATQDSTGSPPVAPPERRRRQLPQPTPEHCDSGDLRRDEVNQCLSTPDVELLQHAVCMEGLVDGRWGDRSVAFLTRYERRFPIDGANNATGTLSKARREQLLALTETSRAHSCELLIAEGVSLGAFNTYVQRLIDVPFVLNTVSYRVSRPVPVPETAHIRVQICRTNDAVLPLPSRSTIASEIVRIAGEPPSGMSEASIILTGKDGQPLSDPPAVPSCAG